MAFVDDDVCCAVLLLQDLSCSQASYVVKLSTLKPFKLAVTFPIKHFSKKDQSRKTLELALLSVVETLNSIAQ